ncbi:MAG: GNAT family N-acetyltransferase [Alphaproteobacteria bacterium]|nr:GNAT family N-acetyltransferase [Alphaproteobacteria bacterium]
MSFIQDDIQERTFTQNDCDVIKGEKSSHRFKSYFTLIGNGVQTPASPGSRRSEHNELITSHVKKGWNSQDFATFQFNCAACQKCKPLRIPTQNFVSPKRSHRRTINRNTDLSFEVIEASDIMPLSYELYKLYDRYLSARHSNSSMNDPIWRKTYNIFKSKLSAHKEICILKLNDQIVGCALLYHDQECLVGNYCFFDPELTKTRSLGTYMDLRLFQYAKDTGRSHVYLGATNRESAHLGHKVQYPNAEVYENEKWIPVEQAYPDLKQKRALPKNQR